MKTTLAIAKGIALGAALIAVAVLSGCAQTVFYRDGKPVASFQGDMTGSEFTARADGSIHWTAAKVNHSTPTLAQGQAASAKIQSIGTALAISGIAALAK
jgi:hypothetical protein